MANGYLGKISAVVSANTADFQSKLNAAAKDVQKFASSMQGSLTSAQAGSSSALRGIYTDAQKLERALTAISTRKLSFRGFADKDINTAVGRMQALYSATEQINKPLASAAKAFGRLPAEIQGAFLPALISSQKAAESLADEINRTGKVSEQRFDAVAAKIDRTTAAMSRLKEASSLVAGLSTGRELAFQRPEMVAETRRSASIQSDIGKLPTESIAGYAELVSQQRTAAVETERLASALEKAKLSRGGDVAAATAAYQAQIALQRKLNDEVEQRVQTEADASRRAAAAADNEIAILIRREQAAKAAEQARLRSRDFTLGSAAPQQRDLGLFGTPAARGAEDAIGRAKQLSAEFEKLPDAAKRSIAGLAQIAGRLSNDLQSGKADASALNQVLDRLETSVRSLSAAEQQRAAAAQARQRALAAEIAQNDRLITQERELAAARQAEMAASRQQESGSLDAAEQALIGPRRMQERPLNEVYGGLGQQAQDFRSAVDSTFGLPQFGEFRDQARRAGAEIQSIKSEIQRLSTLDPQRDAAEYADAWGRVGTRVRAVSDMMAAGTRLAQTAAGGAPPEPPEIIDRNQDRLGAFSPMDRNAGNIGARTSLGGQGARTDISNMGRMSSLEDRRRDLARQAVGEDIEAPRRQLAALASSITSVKGQLDTLPNGIRTRFVPAIREAEAEFIRLSAAPNALPGAIDAARQRVQQLSADAARATQAMNFQQSFGGAGAAGLNLGLDQRALQGYNAQLQILQGAIGRASAEARGPAVAAFDRLRTAVATAFDEGNIDSGVQRDRLAAIRTEAIAAAAAVSRIRVGSLTRDVARAGDVGRAGFDRFALAANQAGYAIDDFLSSTGGLEFKLRAISNNITQLAFILGGTAGLFIGLGAVIGGQVALGLMKWYNNGRTAEDQTKALNESLARQKSLVEELAEAFKSLGDSMSRGTLSEGGQQTKDFADQVETIRKKGRESREGRVSDLDRNVQRERAQQNAYKKQLESETDIGRRVVIARQIEQSKAAERQAMDRVRDRPEPTGADVAGLIERAAARMEESGRSQRPSDTEFPVATSIRDAGAGLDVGSTPEAIRAQIRALRNATSAVSETSAQTFFGLPTEESATSNVAAAAFADMTERLTAKLEAAIEELAINVVAASRGPAEQIQQAQEEVAKAIELGLPGARVFQAELDKNATALQKSIKKLETTFSGKDESGKELTVDEKEARTKQAQAEIDALQAQRARIAGQSDAFRYERTVDPQRQIDARMGRATSNLGAAGLEDGRIARRMREIENERETIRQRSALPEFQAPDIVRGLQDAEQALNEEAAAIEAATIAVKAFGEELNRASEEARGNLNSAQQRADEARRADLGNSTPQTQEARRQAEADLERQREVERAAQTEIAVERDRLEQRAASPEATRIQQIDEELKSGMAGDRESLIREREALQAKVEDDARAGQDRINTARDASTREAEQAKAGERGRELSRTPERRFREESEQGLADIQAYFERRAEANNGIRPVGDVEAQAAAEERFRKDREKEARTATSEGRGAELGMTERDRFRRNFREGDGKDINARAAEMRAAGENPNKFLRQAFRNQMEAVAPMLKGFEEERQNAMLQGPSRAALNVSDVSTSQGASELTRLIRGDDSAKDVNLAELRKQSDKLDEVVKAIRDANPGVLL
jgi:hypothetical protein